MLAFQWLVELKWNYSFLQTGSVLVCFFTFLSLFFAVSLHIPVSYPPTGQPSLWKVSRFAENFWLHSHSIPCCNPVLKERTELSVSGGFLEIIRYFPNNTV